MRNRGPGYGRRFQDQAHRIGTRVHRARHPGAGAIAFRRPDRAQRRAARDALVLGCRAPGVAALRRGAARLSAGESLRAGHAAFHHERV